MKPKLSTGVFAAAMALSIASFICGFFPALKTLQLYCPLWLPPALAAGALFGISGLTYYHARSRALALRTQEARLQQQDREHIERLDRFIRRLDHETKNPLAVIELSLTGMGSNQVQDAAIETIRGQTRQLSTIISALRQITELRSSPIDVESVSLRAVIDDVLHTLSVQGVLRAQTVDVALQDIPAPVPDISADPDLLFLVLYNLISNALKYSDSNSTVRVSAETSRDLKHVEIQVSDNGIGIPADDLQIVWEELARGSNSRRLPGSGMGLSIVHQIVSMHHGEVFIDSVEGAGTRVHVDLPIDASAPSSAPLREGGK